MKNSEHRTIKDSDTAFLNIGVIVGKLECGNLEYVLGNGVALVEAIRAFTATGNIQKPSELFDYYASTDDIEKLQLISNCIKALQYFPKEDSLTETLSEFHQTIFQGKEFHHLPGEWSDKNRPKDIESITHKNGNLPFFEFITQTTQELKQKSIFRKHDKITQYFLPYILVQQHSPIFIPLLPLSQLGTTNKNPDKIMKNISTAYVDFISKVDHLQKTYRTIRIRGLGTQRKNLSQDLIPIMMQHPIFTIKQLQSLYIGSSEKVSIQTLNETVADLERLNVLKEITGNTRNRKFSLHEYVNLFDKLYAQL